LNSLESQVPIVSEDDVLQWHIRTMVQMDRIASNAPPEGDGAVKQNIGRKKKVLHTQKAYTNLEKSNTLQVKKRAARANENLMKGSSRSAPAYATVKHIPTFNKQRHMEEKRALEHSKLAKKLQLLDKIKKREAKERKNPMK
jgi:hypothetical protein